MLVIDEVPHRPHMAYQVLTADHYVGGAIAPTLRAITARLRQQGIDEGPFAAPGTARGRSCAPMPRRTGAARARR